MKGYVRQLYLHPGLGSLMQINSKTLPPSDFQISLPLDPEVTAQPAQFGGRPGAGPSAPRGTAESGRAAVTGPRRVDGGENRRDRKERPRNRSPDAALRTQLRFRPRQNERSAAPTGREAAAATRPARPCCAGAAAGALHAGSCSQRGAPGRRRIAGAKAEGRRTSASGGRGMSSPGSRRPFPSRWQRRAGARRA